MVICITAFIEGRTRYCLVDKLTEKKQAEAARPLSLYNLCQTRLYDLSRNGGIRENKKSVVVLHSRETQLKHDYISDQMK